MEDMQVCEVELEKLRLEVDKALEDEVEVEVLVALLLFVVDDVLEVENVYFMRLR